ncbi:hypothetical protein CBS147343_10508 [Aspergillus niger]|nr:hypothetical protein CBS133816_280 [Aspergillus niger]KAI2863405.1 hypothetical protein CBS12448_3962 [Aspergillus niger]KAI2915513.1 hypothetical protein CBS147371_5798 [Aspergillus niger]KAI2951125.1 hypothetical protein CBS147321_1394 [Aspergillus niger]KAI2953931.1 hypothetical protein CBS147322_4094 [Aspergillus niger]
MRLFLPAVIQVDSRGVRATSRIARFQLCRVSLPLKDSMVPLADPSDICSHYVVINDTFDGSFLCVGLDILSEISHRLVVTLALCNVQKLI